MSYLTLEKSLSGKNLFYFTLSATLLTIVFFFKGFILSFIAALVVTLFLGANAIPVLKEIKFGQVIREDGPASHFKKSGTPTLGGVFLIIPAIIISLIASQFDKQVIACSLLTFSYLLIGFADDYKIIKEKSSKGLSPRIKLIGQASFASMFVIWEIFSSGAKFMVYNTPVSVNPLLYFFVAVFILVAYSNSTNLTDGLDGLCSGVSLIVALLAAVLILPFQPNLSLMLVILAGSCLGFLYFNSNPARVFMGDTGSLAIGGMIGSIALLSGQIIPIGIMSLIYILETLSVILQVIYYKHTKDPVTGVGKRLFKMAPFHHHLEKCGMSEVSVNILAYTFTLFIGLFALVNFIR
jgi:phospho-N-acetylmuramoyl-pentapeptide-transferase